MVLQKVPVALDALDQGSIAGAAVPAATAAVVILAAEVCHVERVRGTTAIVHITVLLCKDLAITPVGSTVVATDAERERHPQETQE